MTYDVLIIGAGAAGMMAAATAGQRGRRVLLLDHAEKLAEKIRVSGGGKCNFSNRVVTPDNFLSNNPHFVRSALSRYGSREFLALVNKYAIPFEERDWGQLFCLESAGRIIDMLKRECDLGQVDWCRPCPIDSVRRGDDGLFHVATPRGLFAAPNLIVATGGLAAPKIGATPFGYKLAEQFGLKMVAPRPALVPLSFDTRLQALCADLSGISLDAATSCGAGRFREAMLITHRGLSGPAILQVSSYWQMADEKEPISIDLLPDMDAVAWLTAQRRSRQLLPNFLGQHLPQRFAQAWCALHGWEKPLDQMSNRDIEAAGTALNAWQVMPTGTLGHGKAEVTLGGVDTTELSSKTMEARKVPGLYFVGEVMDVTGHLGGYNFQWAWSSGHAAGEAV